MDKKAWIKELVKLADDLDQKGLASEAVELDSIIQEAIMVDPISVGLGRGTQEVMDRVQARMRDRASPAEIKQEIVQEKGPEYWAQLIKTPEFAANLAKVFEM